MVTLYFSYLQDINLNKLIVVSGGASQGSQHRKLATEAEDGGPRDGRRRVPQEQLCREEAKGRGKDRWSGTQWTRADATAARLTQDGRAEGTDCRGRDLGEGKVLANFR